MLEHVKSPVSFCSANGLAWLHLLLALFSMGLIQHNYLFVSTLSHSMVPMSTVPLSAPLQTETLYCLICVLCPVPGLLSITYQLGQLYLHSPLPQLTFLATTNYCTL